MHLKKTKFIVLFILTFLFHSGCSSNKKNEINHKNQNLQQLYYDYKNVSNKIEAEIEITDRIIIKNLRIVFTHPHDTLVEIDLTQYGEITQFQVFHGGLKTKFKSGQKFSKLKYEDYPDTVFHSLQELTELTDFECDCYRLCNTVRLSDFPASIRSISLYYSQIDSFIIEDPSKFQNLEILRLHCNQNLIYIDPNICRLPKLKELWIFGTKVQFSNFRNLKNIEVLSLDDTYNFNFYDSLFLKENHIQIMYQKEACLNF